MNFLFQILTSCEIEAHIYLFLLSQSLGSFSPFGSIEPFVLRKKKKTAEKMELTYGHSNKREKE